MPRAWLVPIRRLHKLAGRELATGCRSRRDSSSLDQLCCCQICSRSYVTDEDTVGCTSTRPFVKDGSQSEDDFTCEPMYLSRSEVSPHTVGFTSQPVKAAIANLKARQHIEVIAPLKDPSHQYKLTTPLTHSKLYVSTPRLTRKVSNQNLPFVARSLSTNSGCVQNSSMYGPGDRNLFLENLKSAREKNKKELDIQSLQSEFASFFQPIFAVNCVMLPCKLTDHSAAYLHGQVHGFTKNWPLYLSSLDFMERVKSCSADQVQHLVDHIVKRKILISKDWDQSYGNIMFLTYDPSSDTSFVRAECDAAFQVLNKVNGCGVAKVSILIWKGKELVHADIIEDIKCNDSVGAEILAGLAVLMKCKDLGFQKLELWSDSSRVIGMLKGSESLPMDDNNRDDCLLLRCMQTEFTELIPVFKPRELMFVADKLLKLEGPIEYKIEKALEMWSSELKDQTLLCVTNTKSATTVIKKFAQTRMTKKDAGYVYKPDHIFFCKVKKGNKFAALSMLSDVFQPDDLLLAMHKFEEKSATLRQMVSKKFLPCVSGSSGSITMFSVTRNVGNSVKKPILVVWDSCLHKEYCEDDSCVIVLVEDDEEVLVMEAAKIKEMNISTYLYFNGVEFKEEAKEFKEEGKILGNKWDKRSKRGRK